MTITPETPNDPEDEQTAEEVSSPPYHDLDALTGTWSDAEAEEFLDATRDFGKIDEEMWR